MTFKKGKSSWNKGKKLSEEHRKKLSESHKGQVAWNKGTKGIMKPNNGSFQKGHAMGNKNANWKGGVMEINYSERKQLMGSLKYRNWHKEVFEKYNNRCIGCGELGGRLEADHIYPWIKYLSVRFDVNNGQVLC